MVEPDTSTILILVQIWNENIIFITLIIIITTTPTFPYIYSRLMFKYTSLSVWYNFTIGQKWTVIEYLDLRVI